MKCEQCNSELFLGSRHCPVCGAATPPPAEGKAMSRIEFFRLALPQKFQSMLHTGILLSYLSVLASLICSFWMPKTGMIQALVCLIIAIGVQATKSVIWTYLGTVLAAGSLAISVLAEGNFVCLFALIGCIFAFVGAHALSVAYAAYIVSGRTPEIGDEEGQAMVLRYGKRRNLRIAFTALGGLLIGVAAVASAAFYLSGQDIDEHFTPGSLTDGGQYTNEFAGISLAVPESWTVYDREELEKGNLNLTDVEKSGDSMEFLASNADQSVMIQLDVVRQSSSAYTEKNLLESYVEDGKIRAEANNQTFTAEQFENRLLGGEEYLCLVTRTEDSAAHSCRIYLCRQIGSYSVIFRLYGPTDGILDEFSGWFETQ